MRFGNTEKSIQVKSKRGLNHNLHIYLPWIMSNAKSLTGPSHNKMEWTTESPISSLQPTSPVEKTSPLSDTVIIEYDPDTGKTHRRVCASCRRFIESDETVKHGAPFFQEGVGDPLYFIGAGVRYWSLIVPHWGRVAFHRWENWEEFRGQFSYDQKREWSDLTGVPFPYEFFN